MRTIDYNIPDEVRGHRFTGHMRQTDRGWWIASCEEIPGAVTQGASVEEARGNLAEAIALMLEDMTPEELEELLEALAERDRGEHWETITV